MGPSQNVGGVRQIRRTCGRVDHHAAAAQRLDMGAQSPDRAGRLRVEEISVVERVMARRKDHRLDGADRRKERGLYDSAGGGLGRQRVARPECGGLECGGQAVGRVDGACDLAAGDGQRDHESIGQIAAQQRPVGGGHGRGIVAADRDVDVDRGGESVRQCLRRRLGLLAAGGVQSHRAVEDMPCAQEGIGPSQSAGGPARESLRSGRLLNDLRLLGGELCAESGPESRRPTPARTGQQYSVDMGPGQSVGGQIR